MNYSKAVVLLCNLVFLCHESVSISESPWQKNQKTILQNLKDSISLNLYMPLECHACILMKPKKETWITEKYAPNPSTSSLMSYWQCMCSCLYPDGLISADVFTCSIKHKNDSTSSICCPLPSHIFVQSVILTNIALTCVCKVTARLNKNKFSLL